MQTTLRLDDSLYRKAKIKASELGISLTKLLEEALSDRLKRLDAKPKAEKINLPVSSKFSDFMKQDDLGQRIEDSGLLADQKLADASHGPA